MRRRFVMCRRACFCRQRFVMASPQSVLDGRSTELLLALTPGIGPRLRKALVAHFGSAEAVMTAAASDLRDVPGIGQKLSRSIVTARGEVGVDAELRQCVENGVTDLVESAAGYSAMVP